MGRPKGSKNKKDKFDALEAEFKDAMEQSSPEEIRRRISDVAMLEVAVRQQLKDDPDVAQARDALSELTAPYREDLKGLRLQLEYCKQMLENKGSGPT